VRETVLRYGWPNYSYWPGGQFEHRLGQLIESPPPVSLFNHVTETLTAKSRERGRQRPGAPPSERGTPAYGSEQLKRDWLAAMRVVRFPFTVKEYTTDQTALLPELSAILDPSRIAGTEWTLTNPTPDEPDNWWPQEFLQLKRPLRALTDGQLGMWRRDSLVRMAYVIDVPSPFREALDGSADLAMLAGGTSPIDTRTIAQAAPRSNEPLRFDGAISSGSLVLSAELLTQSPRAPYFRKRFGAAAPPVLRDMASAGPALSAPVFVHLPERGIAGLQALNDVISQMTSSGVFRSTDRIALYFESYGMPRTEPLQISLQLRSTSGANVIQRFGGLIGVTAQRDSVRIRWTENTPTRLADADATLQPVTTHAVGLDLSPLAPGDYVVRVELEGRSRQAVRSEQRFVIRPP
jgi:hypothetical protein